MMILGCVVIDAVEVSVVSMGHVLRPAISYFRQNTTAVVSW